MFGRNKEAKIDGLEIRFYTDAAVHGSHGKIRVTNRRKGLDNKVVNFVFVGLVTPPDLTPSLMEYIWTEAKAQGYVPHGLVDALEVNNAEEEPAAVLTPAQMSEAVNLQELGRVACNLSTGDLTTFEAGSAVKVFDPSKASDAEIPAFLRKDTPARGDVLGQSMMSA
jgi:hypothetical protein